MVKIKKRTVILIILLTLLGLAVVFSSNTVNGAIEGLSLCANVIVPSLFPLTVLALFVFNSGAYTVLVKFAGLDFTVWLLSALGGYPCGAILIERLYLLGVIDKKRGEKMLCFCVNAGPSFIVYTVGKIVLGNTFFGVLLLVIHLIPSFAFMLVCALTNKNADPQNYLKIRLCDAFVMSVKGGLEGALSLSAAVTFIFSLCGMLKSVLPQEFLYKTFGFIEVTYGIKSNPNNLHLISFLLGFSGVSVIFQILFVQDNLKPSLFKIFSARILHATSSFLISAAAFSVFMPRLSAAARQITARQYPLSTTFSIIICCIVFLIFLNPKQNEIKIESKNKK